MESRAKLPKFQRSWELEFAWLDYRSDQDKMFCRYCTAFSQKAETNNQFVNGTSHFKKETVRVHSQSIGHRRAAESFRMKNTSVRESSLATAFKKAFLNWDEQLVKDLRIKITTAYHIAKMEKPFVEYESLMELQHLNGLTVSKSYNTDKKCAEFISYISASMLEQIKQDLKHANYISLLADGCTDSSVSENEQLHIRYVKNGLPCTVFLSLKAVTSADASGIYISGIKAGLESLGQRLNHLKIVAFCADGASVNLGAKNGVAALMRKDVGEHLIEVHCWAHNLELAALDAKKRGKSNIFHEINELLQSIWYVYHYSPKARRELGIISKSLDIKAFRPVKLKGTRWVPHLSRALSQLLKYSLPAILMHQEHRMSDAASRIEIKGKAKFILDKLKNKKFVASCHFVLDIFEILKELSEFFQAADVTMPDAWRKLEETTSFLEVLSTTPKPNGHYETYVRQHSTAEDEDLTLGLTSPDLENSIEAPAEMKNIVNDIVNYLQERFSAFIGKTDPKSAESEQRAKVLKAFLIFDVGRWPKDLKGLANFGRTELNVLISHFSEALSCDVGNIQPEWFRLKVFVHNNFMHLKYTDLWKRILTDERESYPNICHLIQILLVLPISTASVERGFSNMKRIKTDARSCLHVDTLSDLMRISIDGPELSKFQADAAMILWKTDSGTERRPSYKSWPTRPDIVTDNFSISFTDDDNSDED